MGSIVPTIGTAAREAAQAFAQQPFSSLAGAARGGVSLYNLAEGVQNRAQQERTDDVTLQQLRARSALDEAQALEDAALTRARIAQARAKAEADRRDALRRAMARQRARFGAGGLDSAAADGSAEAVLLGLVREEARDAANDDADTALRLQALDTALAQRSSLNLLQAAQLAKRQDIKRLFG
ncbi:MAG TPA: hypothetical protein DDX54_07115 [Rhodospirillaceae bacterium]|jgi:hypothetical protein|nr:hypothetical protein [Alphaproteobacteria bacterium]HBH27147.1 hypothetical protein [Rhodospirillaceae bacterium]